MTIMRYRGVRGLGDYNPTTGQYELFGLPWYVPGGALGVLAIWFMFLRRK